MSNFYRIVAIILFTTLSVLTLTQLALAQNGQSERIIEDIEVRGNRRIPRDTILYSVQCKPGDLYSEAAARRDTISIRSRRWSDTTTSSQPETSQPRR